MSKDKVKTKKKVKKIITDGIVNVHASFNNTIVSFTDMQGNSVCWATAGSSGFKGSRKSTPYAAQIASEKAATIAKNDFSMKNVSVRINGPGPGRDSAVRALINLGFVVSEISDVTGIPHNGCRAQKKRRV